MPEWGEVAEDIDKLLDGKNTRPAIHLYGERIVRVGGDAGVVTFRQGMTTLYFAVATFRPGVYWVANDRVPDDFWEQIIIPLTMVSRERFPYHRMHGWSEWQTDGRREGWVTYEWVV